MVINSKIYSPTQTITISKKFVELHAEYAPTIIAACKKAVSDGSPVNAPIWWIAPTDKEAHKIWDGMKIKYFGLHLEYKLFHSILPIQIFFHHSILTIQILAKPIIWMGILEWKSFYSKCLKLRFQKFGLLDKNEIMPEKCRIIQELKFAIQILVPEDFSALLLKFSNPMKWYNIANIQ